MISVLLLQRGAMAKGEYLRAEAKKLAEVHGNRTHLRGF